MENMPWVYLSEKEVPVTHFVRIPDIYVQLLRYEQEGLLTIRRWNNMSVKQREIWENVVRRSLIDMDLTTPLGIEYGDFVREHFPKIMVGKEHENE